MGALGAVLPGSGRLVLQPAAGRQAARCGRRSAMPPAALPAPRPSHFRDNSSLGGNGGGDSSGGGTAPNESVMAEYINHVYNSMNDMETVGLTVDHDVVTGTPAALRSLDVPKLLASMAQIQRKNTELQQQLTETVGMLSTAAEVLNNYSDAKQLHSAAAVNGSASRRANGAVNGANGHPHGAPGGGEVSPDAALEAALRAKLQAQKNGSEFAIQHPGTMASTKTSLARDFDTDSCMVTVQAVARLTSVPGSDQAKPGGVEMPHLVALAAQAAVNSAAELSRTLNTNLKATTHTARRMNVHKHLRKVLLRGAIVQAESMGASEFGHESFRVELKDPDSEQIIKAIFKPRVAGDAQGWHRAPIEAVAYKLNLLLGMDHVPPVAYRTGGMDVDYHHFEEGAFMYFAENASELKEHDPATWGIPKEVLLSDTRILDVLLHNSDRHHGHFLMGSHWVEGRWEGSEWKGIQRPILIDHAAGFRQDAVVTMEHDNAFQTGSVRVVSAKTYLRLRFLDASSIANSFSHFLSEREMREMLIRRNQILRYLDGLVETQGYSNTVIE
mmetsp:Transcript_16712/g.42855  ORF Transcript_16712/g.42855 Transcript_16712/m.42855 type:complete len:557 (-) Transcript_16712:206-1876(-)